MLLILINLLAFISQVLILIVDGATLDAAALRSYGYRNQSVRINLYIENITTIDPDTFNGFTKLTTLYLASLTEFDLQVLKAAPNLAYLSLSNNRLTQLTNVNNIVHDKLETLVLTNTSISNLEASVINAFPNLVSFYGFSLTNLSRLVDNQLSSWPKLVSLQLTTNNQHRLNAGLFNGLKSIQSIYFWSSNISVIDSDTFSNLSSLQTLDLMNNSLNSVDHVKLPNSLIFFRCAANNLSSLNFTQGLVSIQALDLSQNRFTTFASINFSQLVNLTMLLLNSNPINNPNDVYIQIQPAAANLIALSLNQIGIRAINSNFFLNFTRLQILSLRSNNISKFDAGSFQTLLNLTTLSLINNSLSRLDAGVFTGLGELKNLLLSMNSISDIDPATFNSLVMLENLVLSDNKLSLIDSRTFYGLSKLKSINLNNNKLTSIASGTFHNLTSLQKIDLDENELTYLDSSTFAGCSNLVKISIKKNPQLRLDNIQDLCQSNPKCQVLF